MYTLFQGAIIWKPSPKGGSSVTTPPPKVLNKTPASPYPMLIEDLEIKIKAMAIAECMSNNNKQPCYLYAINDKIVWNFPTNSSNNQTGSIKERLQKLKLFFEEEIITREEYDAKRKEILDEM